MSINHAKAEHRVYIDWQGRTATGHHLLNVTYMGHEFSFPVDPKDFTDENAMNQIVADVEKHVKETVRNKYDESQENSLQQDNR